MRTAEIIDFLKDYIQQRNDEHSIWHIGIGEEAHDIVFEALKRSSQYWMYIETGSPQAAQKILEYFIDNNIAKNDKRGFQQNEMSSLIYVYRKQRTPVKQK
jgi:hypothetical protein